MIAVKGTPFAAMPVEHSHSRVRKILCPLQDLSWNGAYANGAIRIIYSVSNERLVVEIPEVSKHAGGGTALGALSAGTLLAE